MWNVGSYTANDAPASAYDAIKVPYALAKVFQQFGEYVDPLTGTKYKWLCPPLALTLNTTFFSIDTNTTTGGPGNLNLPKRRNLIHATRWGASTAVEYCSLGNKAFTTFSPNSTSWDTYFPTIGPYLGVANALTDGSIEVKDIPLRAPDASSYTFVTSTHACCPVSNFRSDMAYICNSPNFTTNPPDVVNNFAYDKPRPVVRVASTVTAEDTGSTTFVLTLMNMYFTVLFDCKHWKSGSAISLVKSIPRFATLTEFSYRANLIDLTKVSSKFAAVYRSATWLATDGNKAFTLSWMYWSQIYARLIKYGAINCVGAVDSNTAFYAMNVAAIGGQLPGALSMVVSNLGPTVIDGKFYTTQLGLYPINGGAQTAGSWNATLGSTGVWNVGANAWSILTGTTPKTPITITSPGTANPLTRTDPVGVVYSWTPVALLEGYVSAYQNSMPVQLQMDSACTPSNELLGTISGSQVAIVSDLAPFSAGPFDDALVTIPNGDVAQSVQGNVCITPQDSADALVYSVVRAITTTANILKPMLQAFEANAVDVIGSLQRTMVPTQDSQFQAMKKAETLQLADKYKIAPTDRQWYMNNKLLTDNYKGFWPNIVADGSGDRQQAKKYIENLWGLVKQEGGNVALSKITQQFQEKNGKLTYKSLYDFTADLVSAFYPEVTKVLKNERNQPLLLKGL